MQNDTLAHRAEPGARSQSPAKAGVQERTRGSARKRVTLHERSGGTLSGEADIATCPICLDPLKDKESLHKLQPCNHVFHTGCILESFRWNPRRRSD